MQYSEAIDYLYSRLPVFHRIGAKAIKPGLGNTLRLCEALGNPQQQFRSIHVAGTNGKGSSSHMLAAIYQSAGYRVGLYTSPHLKSFTERIRISGVPIAEESVAQFVVDHQTLIEAVEPSFFEVTVAMAFDYFARQQVDLAIIEVGLGGRLDSTNVITPAVSLITNIGYDHTDILGTTLAEIAGEKGGIIKSGIPAVVSETQAETESVFRQIAKDKGAGITFADQQWQVVDAGLLNGKRQLRVTDTTGHDYALLLDLVGGYQVKNVAGVLSTVAEVAGEWPVTPQQIASGLANVVGLTGLKGRFQQLRDMPRVIVDTAHNQPGLAALFDTIYSLPYRTLHLVVGLVADKDRSAVLAQFPSDACYYFCQAQTPRALPAHQLEQEAAEAGLSGTAYLDVNLALAAALAAAQSDDLILVTGSNYTIAELIDL
ncbi:bifunctional folylpolyglutamate synthase/dihydrofolate synthase [Spirosoma rhododendri]|uniref:Dihydrofolate synthase/folylpolyglutamate synthase n=1 Tax=Spirosoma rhododendri TaxID=2728024 RepID=A0A7L5DTV9_9BACT|nr:folylpolyglutamate synthase/dihydrofolate synthase family protein [Spirosoma rhododendri]QJD80028.1 bifunctional folylpolyglutamate synthase/dihydrofolate synthase [Spirosoma rhododendri]